MAVLLVDVGLAIYILPKDPAMDLFIYSDGVQVDFTIGEFYIKHAETVPRRILHRGVAAVKLSRIDHIVITTEHFKECRRFYTEVLGTSSSQRIGTMVNDVIAHSAQAGDISMSPDVLEAMLGMRAFLFDNLYTHGDAKYEEPKAAVMISELFDHFIAHMDEVPAEYTANDADHPDIQVADFVSGMTDRYAVRRFEELRIPRSWKR